MDQTREYSECHVGFGERGDRHFTLCLCLIMVIAGIYETHITEDFEYRSNLLAVRPFKPSPRLTARAGDVLLQFYDSVLSEYGLDRMTHVRGSTTDGGPDVKRCCGTLMRKVRKSSRRKGEVGIVIRLTPHYLTHSDPLLPSVCCVFFGSAVGALFHPCHQPGDCSWVRC